jgi:hypothetical protein
MFASPHKVDPKGVDKNQEQNNRFTTFGKILNGLLKLTHKQPAKLHHRD